MTGWSSGKVQRLSSSPTNELLQLSPIDKAAFNKPLVAFTPHHVSTDQEELKRPKLPFRLTGVLYLLLTIEFFQGLGVLFTMGVGEGSWPKSVTDNFGWTVFFNLDAWGASLLSAYEGNAQPIVLDDDYTPTFIAWVVVSLLILALVLLVYFFGDRCVCALDPKRAFVFSIIKAVCFTLGVLLVYPAVLALMRPWLCTDSILLVEPTETCSSSYALQFQAIGTIIAACWVFGMTALIFAHIRSCVVFKCSRSHAMHIDLVETNYANGYDLAWLDQGWYLTTPFKRSYAYYTIWIILHKALVVVAYTVLSDIPFAQAGAVLGLFLVSSLMLSLCKPFRIANANLIASCYHIALMAASLLVLMRRTDGSQALLESPYLDREVIAAVAFAGVIAGFVFATWLVSAARHRSQWPAPSSLDAYPPGPLAAMAEASRAMAACWESPWHLAPTHTLAASIHAVQSYVQDPDTPEGVTLQLRHLLDSLLLCYAQVAPHSIYSQAPRASVWTCQKQLALMMPEMRRRMDERDEEYLLMPRHFKRYQLKMVAFLAFRELLLRVRERGHQPRGDTFAIQVRPPSGSSDSASLLDTSEA